MLDKLEGRKERELAAIRGDGAQNVSLDQLAAQTDAIEVKHGDKRG